MPIVNRIATPTPATTPSLFGTPQPQQSTSPFALPTAPATSTGGNGGGLFGASTPASTPSAPLGGLFGAPQAPTATGGGPFSTPTTTSAPAMGGLFGTAPTPAPSAGGGGGGGGLFGASGTPAPATNTGGLFGGTAVATSTAGGGLLGQQATAPATGGGLFGVGTPTQQKPSLFPITAQPATGNTLGTGFTLGSGTTPKPGGLFTASTPAGQQQQGQQQQQQSTAPAATIDITRLTPTTRFSDCHESVQQELEQLDKHIQSQIATAEALSALFPSHRQTVSTIPSDTSVLAHKLSTTKSFLSADQISLSHAQKYHQADNEAATLSIRCLDLFRLPPAQRSQYFQRADNSTRGGENEVTSNAPMVAYFNKHAESMEKSLRVFLESVGEVEASLRSVEQSAAIGGSGVGLNGEDLTVVTGGIGGRQDARRLNRTLREFNDALRDVSGRIVDVKDGLRELKVGGRR